MPMNLPNASWWVELLARLLSPGDRESVLGDLAEAGETGRQAVLSVAGLLIHRQMAVLRNWRPWVAAFGLAMPASFLLMGFSVSVGQSYNAVIGNTVLRATESRQDRVSLCCFATLDCSPDGRGREVSLSEPFRAEPPG